MKKFNVPRKLKKKFKKDSPASYLSKENWEWFYHKKRVVINGMKYIIKYPEIASDEEVLEWYLKHYPNDSTTLNYCRQNIMKNAK